MRLNLETGINDELTRARQLLRSLENMLEDHRAVKIKLEGWHEQEARYCARLAEAQADVERLSRLRP
jgi:hypothetical protein